MVLTDLLHRKLSSLLRPWLRDEPELELKLGIINSLAILENFTLSALALDQLLNDDESSSWCLKEVNVEHLSLRFSNWSVPAFALEVRGVHVTLSVRETKDGSSRKDREGSGSAWEDVKKNISAIDPEGSALHDVLERIVETTPSRDQIATSFLNLILNHCRLQILSFDLQLRFPISDDSFVYISEIKELNAESLAFQQGCLLRGLIGALFQPLKESSFVINGSGFEIGYKRNDHVNRVCISNELFTSVKLDKLQLVDFCLRVPDLIFLFSPLDLRVLAFLGKLSSKESKHASRNGRLLWKLALRRIGYVISAPSLSLHNLVALVSLWLRYVNAYETLLFLLGYSADDLLKRSAVKMSCDKMFVVSVKSKWEVISDIENELPPEAIAQARRIARYRAGSNIQHAEDSYRESSVSTHVKFFSKILPVLACIWKIMYRMFDMLLCFRFLFTFFTQESESTGYLGICSVHSGLLNSLTLNLEKVSIHFFPENSVKPVNERVESQTGTPYSDLSLSLSVDALILMYIEDISEKSLYISCGQLEVISSTFFRDHIMKSSSKTVIASPRGHRKGRVNNILWGRPAQMFPISETSNTIPTGHVEAESDMVLENLLGQMWLNWKKICEKFEDSEIEYSENPWFLCEIKSFLTYPEGDSPDSGLWKCNLAVGKLNLALEYSSMLSIILLFQQIMYALCWDDIGRSRVISTVEAQPEISSDKYESYANEIKMALLRMLPEKHIQVGVLIAGPHIQISSKKVGFLDGNEPIALAVGQDDFLLEFDVHNIEFVVLPALKSYFKSFTRPSVSDDAESECIRLQEPQIIDIPKSDNEKYASQGQILLSAYLIVDGLNAYLAESMEKQHNQIFALKPITIHLSSVREYVHSLTTTVTGFSAALGGMASGFMIISFMDELYVFFQMIAGLLSAVSDTFSNSISVGNLPFEEFMRYNMVSLKHENKENALKGAPLICASTLLSLNGTFELKPMDIIFYNSRISNKIVSVQNIDASSDKKLPDDLLDCGFWISVHKTCVDLFCEEEKVDALIDLSGIKALMVRYEDYMGKCYDHVVLRNLLLQSQNCLHELFLSDSIFALWFGCPHYASSLGTVSDRVGGSNSGGVSHVAETSPLTRESKKSDVSSCRFVQKLGFTPNIFTLAPSHSILISVALGEVLMSRCSIKNGLVGAHQIDKFLSTLSVGGEFQTVTCGIQGGVLFLEVTAMEMFVCCFSSYLDRIENLLSIIQSSATGIEGEERCVDMTGPNNHFMDESGHETLLTSHQAKRGSLEAFTVDVSKFSFVLVIGIEDGGVQELVLEVDAHVNLEMTDMRKKFAMVISRLSFLSQVLQESVENESEIPHFSSVTSNKSSSRSAPKEGSVTVQYHSSNGPFDGASCSRNLVLQNDLAVDDGASDVFCLSHQNYILKHMSAFVSVEKLENNWVGSGSVSGLDMTISLSELQMILSTVASFSGISSKEVASKMTQRHWSINEETDNSLRAIVPDGAIVAIQDINQHMYFTVEGKERKYTLGTIHYSLVGERALFRVKYHKQRRWKSSVLWFSLISLYAKNDSGQPLRLNCRSGSFFVDISCTDDNVSALWRIFPCEPESDKGDEDWEPPRNELVKRTFYLVNKKNDCAVAFIDGVPEFVRKPGNPFKFKMFHNLAMASDFVASERNLDASVSNQCHIESEDEGRNSVKGGRLPCIDIKIDEISLTVVHELLDKDRFSLLCGCIGNTQLTIQILPTKTRVINTSSALLSYFDAQKNSWREFVRLEEICIYYRSSSQIRVSENLLHRVPVHIFCKTKELETFLTERSLDILLFVIGKLNLAGPYLIQSSRILANCCKVENNSGLNLHCHFDNYQTVTIGRKQSASIFLGHSTSANQRPDISSVVSIRLSVLGAFTSSINLAVLEARSLAWKTRIQSAQDSRTYPGPFIVVDISRKSEDGLSIVVSPLVRIHNETEFSMELRFQRTEEKEDEFASVSLKPGDSIDDSMAMFDAISLSGGLKKALMSLSDGNLLFSFRPESPDDLINSKRLISVEWSDELQGRKAVRLSGIFDKLSYEVRKALSVESDKCSFSTARCALKSEDTYVASMHFLIQSIRRNVPIIEPDTSNDRFENKSSPLALQEQNEIFLLPTVRVSNLLHMEIHVLLTETDPSTTTGSENIGKQATIPCGSTANLYANPAIMYFTVTLAAFRSSCKPVNSSDWVKKLLKHKNDVRCLDIDLDFGAGKYYASLRLSRGQRGILEAAIFTAYTLKNETDVSLFLYAPNQKPLSRDGVEKFGSSIPPELGLLLPPEATRSWFSKSHKVKLKLLEDHSSEAVLDLDALSGLTEMNLVVEEESGIKYITKFGLSVGPSLSKINVPSQIITIVPRHVVANESEESIIVRQCYLEDSVEGMILVNSKKRTILQLQDGVNRKREFSLFENFIRKHKNDNDKSLMFIQFRPNDSEFGWSGPLCISSLGRFFLKFKKQSNQVAVLDKKITEFAAVHVAEEGSTLVMHFHKPPNVNLPYRIENCLHGSSITYYQKGSSDPEVLGSERSVDYVWDDLTLPHKLVVLISDMHEFREINLDKVRPWKPFSKLKQHRSLTSHLQLDKRFGDRRTTFGDVGYEVCAEGPTRVLRIYEFSDRLKRFLFSAKIQLRISQLAIHLLEPQKQDLDESDALHYSPIVIGRLGNINLDSVFTDQQKYNQICVQSLNVENKWLGSPFAAMLRRHLLDDSDPNDCVFKIVCVLLSTRSNVKQVKYSSIILQPIDLNLDEETLMRILSFWRTSLSDSNTQSRQFYFDHFEIHPIKIIANFLSGDSYSSYNSAQETLRSLLHSVVKVPSIKNMVVELNGVLVTHALLTTRELFKKCAQHYLWYAMRSIYIAKGSPLLPPGFASIFDDSASSSLDVFFDPSRGLMNLPGFTIGTFKFISKCIGGKGFSGTKRYFGDLGKTLRTAGSNVVFAAVTEISDSVLKGAETSGFDGLVSGFHQGILKLAMEPSLLGTALMGGGPDRKIKLDRSPGIDELYIEGYLQAMLDTMYRQEYLRVRIIEDQVLLKNLPPNNALIEEIIDRVKGFLVSKALLKGDPSTTSRPLRHLRGESEWKIGPTVLTLCEHLFVSFAIRMLRKRADKLIAGIKWKKESEADDKAVVPAQPREEERNLKFVWKGGITKFVLSGILAYIDGMLCRSIPHPVARRIVGGFLLSFLDKTDSQ